MTVRNAVCLPVRDGLLAGGLLVRLDVELDEQAQVAREQQAAEHRSLLRPGARAEAGPVREVAGGVVRVRWRAAPLSVCGAPTGGQVTLTGKVHDKQVDDELYNLEGCEVLLPLYARYKRQEQRYIGGSSRTQILAPPAVA